MLGGEKGTGVLDDAVVARGDHDHGIGARDDELMVLTGEGRGANHDTGHIPKGRGEEEREGREGKKKGGTRGERAQTKPRVQPKANACYMQPGAHYPLENR